MKEKLPVSPGAPWQSGMLPGWRSRGLWLLLVLLALLTAAGLLGLDLGTLLVRLLKIVFGRWRPDQGLAGHFEFFSFKSKCNSFPSGHTEDAAVTATVLWFVYPRLRPLYVAWVVLMAVARLGAAQHFVADSATGAALGILFALLVGRNLEVITRRVERLFV